MSITAAELICYGAASRPEDDVSTTGGAIDATHRPVLTQLTGNAIIEMVSDGADTRNVTVTGRNAAGSVTTETKALNGTTAVDFTTTLERVQKIVIASTNASRTVTFKQGVGGSTVCTIGPNEAARSIVFINSAGDPSVQKVRYDKLFWKNTDGSLSLLGAQVTLTADPQSLTQIGLAAAVNDSVTVANRLATPGGISFVGLNSAQSIPGTDLAAGAAIGVWVSQTLAAGSAAQRTTFTTKLSGSTV